MRQLKNRLVCAVNTGREHKRNAAKGSLHCDKKVTLYTSKRRVPVAAESSLCSENVTLNTACNMTYE